MTGWRLALASLGAFGMPLGLSVTGACWFRGDPVSQLAAGLGGLCLGMILAGAAAMLAHRTSKANP
jgi:hypothetical protein